MALFSDVPYFTITLIILAIFLLKRIKRKNDNSKLPPIPTSTAMFGPAGEYFKNTTATFPKFASEHQTAFTLPLGFLGSWVFITGKEDFKKILDLNNNHCRLGYDFIRPLMPGKHLHSVIPRTPMLLFALRKLDSFCPELTKFAESYLIENYKQEGEIDLFEFYESWIGELTLVLMFGSEDAKKIRGEYFDLYRRANPDMVLRSPFQAFVGFVEGYVLGERRIYKGLYRLLGPLIEKRVEKALTFTPSFELPEDDVLSSMVVHTCKKYKGEKEKILSQSNYLCGSVFAYTMASIGNTFAAASWCTIFCAQRKQLCEDILSEIKSTNDDCINFSNLNNYKLLYSLITEVTRMYTPGALLRKLEKPYTTKDGHVLPAGSTIALSGQLMKNDPIFENPHIFDPKRFLNLENENISDFNIGFGGGKHPCLGKRLAMVEIAIAVAKTNELYEFEQISPRDNELPEVKPDQAGMIHTTKYPVIFKYKRKLKKH